MDEGRPLITPEELQSLIEADNDGTIGALWETMLAVAMQEQDALAAEYGKDPAALAQALGHVDLLRTHLSQFGEMADLCLRRLLSIRRLN
jgi:hypothetical protein